jgi:hypothetical protein
MEDTMKTAKEWFKEIKCPYLRARALSNLDPSVNDKFPSLTGAIGHKEFRWAYAVEGYNFWNKIHDDSPNIKDYEYYKQYSIEKTN